MKQNWISRYWLLPVLFAGAGLSSFSLFDIQSGSSITPPQPKFKAIFAQLKDSIPGKGEEDADDDRGYQFKTGDLDKALKNMEKELEKARIEFKKQDWNKIDAEMKRALKEIDELDPEKIRKETEASIKSIDWEKMQKELQESLKELQEVELPKIKLEMDKEMKNLKLEMEKTKGQLKIDSEKIKKELKGSMEETMKTMELSMEKAKTGLKELKNMTVEMEKDGLIKKGENAKIKFKDGELFINGEKQSKEVTDKYRHYFKKGTFHLNYDDKDDDWL